MAADLHYEGYPPMAASIEEIAKEVVDRFFNDLAPPLCK